jgi:hypothetical protein
MWPKLLAAIALFIACPAGAQTAATVSLAWDPSAGWGVAGYRLYLGGASGVYTNSVTLGNITNVTVSALTAGSTYYFAVTAYTATGLEGPYSGEIAYTAGPVVTPTPPVSSPTLVAAYGFDEGSGSTVNDLSGNNNTGTLQGATWTTGGRFGNALAFDGTNRTAVTVNDAPSLDLTTAFTLEAWVYPTVAGTAWGEIIYKGDVGNDGYLLEGCTPDAPVPAVGIGSVPPPGTILSGPSALPVNVWTHLAGTYDGATLQLYVNGELVASQAKTGLVPTSAQLLSIGGDTLHGTYFTGLIDEVRIYNGAVSASQIQKDMNTPLNMPVAPAGLVAAYGFEEGSGTTLSDASGNGNTGTINGATWTAGRYGNGLLFDGLTALVTISNSASLQLTNGMTLEAWVNPSSVTNAWQDILYKGNDNYYLEASSPIGGQPGVGETFNTPPVYGPAILTVNTWTHLAATYDGATLQLYVNGVQVASQAQSGPIAASDSPLQIGGDNIYGQYFQGVIDEVRVYNRALSASEIAMDMNTPVASHAGAAALP